MTKTVMRYFITVVIVSLALCASISTVIIYNDNLQEKKEDMESTLKIIDYSLDYNEDLQSQIEDLNPLAYDEESRITIIDDEGNVLADSYGEVTENHLDREEVQEAIESGFGIAQRKSETTNEYTLYAAFYDDGYIIRLSVPYNAFMDYVQSMIPAVLISIIISLIVSYFLSKNLAGRISRPILEIGEGIENMSEDYYFDLKEYEYDEFNAIVDTIHNLSHRLRKSIREVTYERKKMDEILKQMSEGFILLDDQNNVLSINQKAIDILGYIEIHANILDYLYKPELIKAIKTNAPETYTEIKTEDVIYACYISRMELGTTLFFVDITAVKNAEKMRSEFFSNVSHELKTPMTSIKGYSELLSNDFILDEDQKKTFIEKIGYEVNNMSNLINDILMLSRLENMETEIEAMPLKMKTITLEVVESHETEALKNNISVHTDFEEVNYIGSHSQIYTLLNNLIGNAIKYNNENGDVWVDIERIDDSLSIVVKDNGIGIPKADQSRIFERFYRVDKGRSRKLGGTGLGLAIVKHIVSLYKGSIHLESELDEGTTITVILPYPKED